MSTRGVVAAGHPQTARAAEILLQEGGNAFDAALGAFFAACVAEPVLVSPGGGGFMLAHIEPGQDVLYDFFVHTPRQPRPIESLDFYPIQADFGTTTQEFHIGQGAIATPGAIKGMLVIHRDLGHMPLAKIIEPAVHLARTGLRMNALQSYIFEVVGPIYRVNPEALAVYGSRIETGRLLREGELLRTPALADTLEALAHEGESLFYAGEIAHLIVRDCQAHGGLLTEADLREYQVFKREPLAFSYRDAQILTNPPPSCGGVLIAFALKLLQDFQVATLGFGRAAHLELLARAMDLTNEARLFVEETEASPVDTASRFLDAELLHAYRRAMRQRARCLRGTTHISVIDARGNMASLTISNGEGSGYVVPGTGIMLNNMLGEEDLNTGGFHCWTPNQRLSSMMSPTLVFTADGQYLAIGSGGSNRIRTAILQILSNLLDFRMSLEEATDSPRIHFERGLLSMEGGLRDSTHPELARVYPQQKHWEEKNLFFGGVHSALYDLRHYTFMGAGDPRRGGVAITVEDG
jgi:gamma-glutamyltranspeptidase/glutathione hydrolase